MGFFEEEPSATSTINLPPGLPQGDVLIYRVTVHYRTVNTQNLGGLLKTGSELTLITENPKMPLWFARLNKDL